jgi:hypothetical protein
MPGLIQASAPLVVLIAPARSGSWLHRPFNPRPSGRPFATRATLVLPRSGDAIEFSRQGNFSRLPGGGCEHSHDLLVEWFHVDGFQRPISIVFLDELNDLTRGIRVLEFSFIR